MIWKKNVVFVVKRNLDLTWTIVFPDSFLKSEILKGGRGGVKRVMEIRIRKRA